MLKMYYEQAHSGSSPNFWEDNWEASRFEESVKFSVVDPLRPLFEEHLKPNSLMLEGGCGMGNYVSYYAGRGYNVIGLDFAQKALKTLATRQPHLKLVGGDVSQMPFADETFDLYYSGGVVEHFEVGAEESLNEARRVLKKDGVLLISVPYHNPLRKMLSTFRNGEWRVVDSSSTDDNGPLNGKKFFQYAYTRREFQKLLENAGLCVIKTQGYAVLWGLYEIPFLNPQGKSEFNANSPETEKREVSAVDIKPLISDREVSLVKRLVVSEDASVPVLGLGVSFLRWAAANMMMYVCIRK